MSDRSFIDLRLHCTRADFTLAVDLQLPARGISVLFGPSGSGKTTLLRCVAGLESAAQGHVRIGDQVWLDTARGICQPVHRRPLGYVFQEASLFEHLDVCGNLVYGLQRTRAASARHTLEEAVQRLGIGHLLSRSVDSLSGGERQRVAIARALVTQPQVLLLDEPLAALDGARKREVIPWLESLRDALDIPVLYVTHSLEELTRLGDHLVVLEQGRVRASGPLTETFAMLDAQALDGQELGVLIEGQVSAVDNPWHLACVSFAGVDWWVRDEGWAVGARVRMRVLARDVSVSTQEPQHTSIQNQVPVWIESATPDTHPSQVLVRLRGPQGHLLARITQRAWSALGLHPGQQVWALVKSVAVVH